MRTRYGYRNNKKNRYSGYTDQYQILKSGYTVLQTRKGLSKAWIGYTIARKRGEHEKLKYYASVIQKLQRELLDAGIISEQYLAKFTNIDIDEKLRLSDIDKISESSEGSEGCME